MWCDLGSMSADVDLHRAKRVSEWRPVSTVLHEVVGLPSPLTDIIAIYALDATFYVHIVNVPEDYFDPTVQATHEFPELYVGFVACGSELLGRGFVSYFGTIEELAVEDHYKTKEIPETRAIHHKIKLEYYYDSNSEVKIEENVRLFDLSMDVCGVRRVYRKVRLPYMRGYNRNRITCA